MPRSSIIRSGSGLVEWWCDVEAIHDPSLVPFIGEWVSKSLTSTGEIGFNGPFNSWGVVHNDELIAGVVFHDWNPGYGTICIQIASTNAHWASRAVIERLGKYAFFDLKCQRITALVTSGNAAALRIAEAVGFKREAVLERGALDQNIIILRLFIEEWVASKFYKGLN
jgi:RimJ/RimL family protein N-acetyltransferase